MILFFDWISWFGLLLAIISTVIVLHGYWRAKEWRIYRSVLNDSYNAVQTGDSSMLHAAPPPESLYDFWIDRITQGFVLDQYERIRDRWFRYRRGFWESEASQGVAELEYRKTHSALEADTDEEKLRGSKARRERWSLWEPLPEPPRQPQPEKARFESEAEEIAHRHQRFLRDDKVLADAGLSESSTERRRLRAQYEADTNEIQERWGRHRQ